MPSEALSFLGELALLGLSLVGMLPIYWSASAN